MKLKVVKVNWFQMILFLKNNRIVNIFDFDDEGIVVQLKPKGFYKLTGSKVSQI